MTIWDDIYKNYQKGGEELKDVILEEIHPLFKEFLGRENFKIKCALDIGCGTGKYLKFLQAQGFKTEGIDTSETAVEMTKKLLGDDSAILCANMFGFEIPKNRYDLIISFATLHHGTKEYIRALVREIHEALADEGKIFISMPSFESLQSYEHLENQEMIAEGTFAPLAGPEKGLPHSFYTGEEIEKLFSKFKNARFDLDSRGRWIVQAEK